MGSGTAGSAQGDGGCYFPAAIGGGGGRDVAAEERGPLAHPDKASAGPGRCVAPGWLALWACR